MKIKLSLAIALMIFFSMARSQEITLDEILARYANAMGMEKLQGVSTMIMDGTLIQQDAMPVKIVRMRPDRYLMEFDIQDITASQGYDGQTAWWTTPWAGNPGPQLMPEERARDLKSRADFDGILAGWKTKGHLVELVGRDTVEKAPAYRLKITRRDGGIEYLFIDAETFLVHKRLTYRKARGQDVAVENYFRDYRPVEGILFAFTQDTFLGGQPYNSLQFDSIRLNAPVEAAVFGMPVK
ncbi:MAG: hypothetical protein WCK34_08150 [Bacteroidota bacterium]